MTTHVGGNRAQAELAELSTRAGFLVWAALCSGVLVAVATDVTWGHGLSLRIGAAVFALLVGVALTFVLPYLALLVRSPAPGPREAAPVPQPAAAQPVAAEAVATEPVAAQPAPVAQQLAPRDTRRDELLGRLRLGESLHERLEGNWEDAGALAHEVDDWVASTRRALEVQAPSFAPYFAALAAHPELATDARLRLERHLARLRTIVGDL